MICECKSIFVVPSVRMAWRLALEKNRAEIVFHKNSRASGKSQCDSCAAGFDGHGAGLRIDVQDTDVQPPPVLEGDVSIVAGREGVVVDDGKDARGCSNDGFHNQVGQ
jgi:hypothetical protein